MKFKMLFVVALCVSGFCYAMEQARKTVVISGKAYVVENYIDRCSGSVIEVVDISGWQGLSLSQQIDRAVKLGQYYNSFNAGPEYLKVLWVLMNRFPQ